jgi:hypothetical protein
MYSSEFDLYKFNKKKLNVKRKILIALIPNALFVLCFIIFSKPELKPYRQLSLYINVLSNWIIFRDLFPKLRGKLILNEISLKIKILKTGSNRVYNISEMSNLIINFAFYKEDSERKELSIKYYENEFYHNYISFIDKKGYSQIFYYSIEDKMAFRRFQWILRFWTENNIDFTYTYRGEKVNILFEP